MYIKKITEGMCLLDFSLTSGYVVLDGRFKTSLKYKENFLNFNDVKINVTLSI